MTLLLDHYTALSTAASTTSSVTRFSRLERILLHLDITKLNALDKLLEVCKRNGMITAMFLIYNLGLGDYFSPMRVVMQKLKAEPHDEVSTTSFIYLFFLNLLYI